MLALLAELLMYFFGDLLISLVAHLLPSFRTHERNVFFGIVGYALIGALLGGLSLFALPEHLVRGASLRIVNLVVTPLIVAAAMAWIGAMRHKRDKRVVRAEEFVYAYAIALTFAMVRFFGAT